MSEPPLLARRPVIIVDGEHLRERVRDLLGHASEDFSIRLVDEGRDPLGSPEQTPAQVLIVGRSEFPRADLARIDGYTSEEHNPELVVVADGADAIDRTRLLSAGVNSVVDAVGPADELREAVEAIVRGEGGAPGDPSAARGEAEPALMDFASRSPRMRRFLRLVNRVIDTDSSLLLTGETGVGKERLAQAIHNEGARASGPFVSVNCGAIPESLLESELFGHQPGAFTGAERLKRGRFELAERGTIFLDEIGEMPLHLQVSLLSVLQRRRVQRVGGEELIGIDVRVVAATNRDLEDLVRKGRFREDLYYRLNVVNLEVPPLRERSEDIPDMVGKFIGHLRTSLGRQEVDGITREALEALRSYEWPGNVRQLVNAVERALVLCSGREIGLEDLPDSIRSRFPDREAAEPRRPAPLEGEGQSSNDVLGLRPLREERKEVLESFEREYLVRLLRSTRGRVGQAALRAGITPRSLYDKLRRHGLRKEQFRADR